MSRIGFLASLMVPVALASSLQADDSAKTGDKAIRERQVGVCNASSMTGATVKDKAGESLASVEDIVVDQEGRVQYLILGHGGVLGIGADYIAAPWKAVSYNARTKELSLPMTSAEIEKAPLLKKDNYQELHNAQWLAKVNTFFRTDGKDDKKSEQADAENAGQKETAVNVAYLRTSQIIGANIRGLHKNEDGELETLGNVNDLIMTQPGQFSFVVLGKGGALGVGETDIAVPWKAMKMVPNPEDGPALTLDITSEKLKNAPVLKQENYNDLTDRNFVRQAHSYFGITSDREEFEAETDTETDKPKDNSTPPEPNKPERNEK